MHFSQFQRLGRLTSRHQHIECLVKPSFSHKGMCPHQAEVGKRTFWGLFYKDTDLIHEDPPSNLITSQRAHLSDAALRIKFQHVDFGGYKRLISETLFFYNYFSSLLIYD